MVSSTGRGTLVGAMTAVGGDLAVGDRASPLPPEHAKGAARCLPGSLPQQSVICR